MCNYTARTDAKVKKVGAVQSKNEINHYQFSTWKHITHLNSAKLQVLWHVYHLDLRWSNGLMRLRRSMHASSVVTPTDQNKNYGNTPGSTFRKRSCLRVQNASLSPNTNITCNITLASTQVQSNLNVQSASMPVQTIQRLTATWSRH